MTHMRASESVALLKYNEHAETGKVGAKTLALRNWDQRIKTALRRRSLL